MNIKIRGVERKDTMPEADKLAMADAINKGYALAFYDLQIDFDHKNKVITFQPRPELLSNEALQADKKKIWDIVAPKKKNPSEGSYEAHRVSIKRVLSKHGVLTHDGWEFITDNLVEDLARLK